MEASDPKHIRGGSLSTDTLEAPALTDNEQDMVWVERMKFGDHEALRSLWEKYSAKIRFAAYSIIHNEQDAEEITSDTFRKFYNSVVKFKGDCSVLTYLNTIVRRLAYNRWHYKKSRKDNMKIVFDAPLNDHEHSNTLADILADPNELAIDTKVDMAQLKADVYYEVVQLSPKMREALLLVFEGRKYREIASILGTDIGTVKSRVGRARKILRLRLNQARGFKI